MDAPLLSVSWYRVAALKPALRAHARLHRHRYRGELWYLLQDPVSNRVHRFTPGARLLISAMNGERSVAQLWELANRRLGEAAPTQDEVITLLGQLHAADLLQSDVTPDASELFDRGERQATASKRRSYMNPMAVRIALWDPDAFLNRMRPFIDAVWSRWGALAWLAVVLPALLLVPVHWAELTGNVSDRVLATDNLLLLGLVFPVIKALHELGHAAAIKAGGGEVHDMGVILLVLFPVPYVEASAASAFKSKYQRALVGAAGMVVELFVAALAFYFWLLVEPGAVRAVLFNVMLVASVSTLIFNGNPLLRYDAYYILADLIEIPNLAKRALAYWAHLAKRYLFGMRELDAPRASPSEKAWFLIYGPASTAYRVFVTVAIALFVASRFFVVGVVLALWAVAAMVGLPLLKGLKQLGTQAGTGPHRARVIGVSLALTAAVVVGLFVLPVPFRSSADGVIWLPEQALVRAGTDGFVTSLLHEPGTRVARGDALIESRDPQLRAQLRLGEAKVRELEASHAAQFASHRARAQIVLEQLRRERAELARLQERVAALTVHAATAGVFVAPRAEDMPGRYHRQGELLAYVIEPERALARVVVPQDTVDLVRQATEAVGVRRAHRPDVVSAGRIVREVPAGDAQLPSRALAAEGGGHILTDPRDTQGARSMERMFQFDIELQDTPASVYFGERVHVRFEHAQEPLALQWYRDVRRLFLTHFNV